MADTILTQAEIDNLLASITSDPDSGGSGDPSHNGAADSSAVIRQYDFRTANRFPRDQIRTFNIVFQNFVQLFSNQLTGLLRTTCECEVVSIEESSFNEFNNSLPSPVILSVLQAPPMNGHLLLSFYPECAYIIINRLLGGVGNGGASMPKAFTEIDLAMMERTVRLICSNFTEAWSRILALDASVERLETSSQFAQIAALSEATVVIIIMIHIGNEEGMMSFCIPHTAIEPITKALVARNYFNADTLVSEDTRRMYKEHTRRQINAAGVDLIANFNETAAYVSDVMSLRVGDVVRLDHRLNEPLTIKAADVPKFKVVVGNSGGNYALKINEIIEETEDESEDEELLAGLLVGG